MVANARSHGRLHYCRLLELDELLCSEPEEVDVRKWRGELRCERRRECSLDKSRDLSVNHLYSLSFLLKLVQSVRPVRTSLMAHVDCCIGMIQTQVPFLKALPRQRVTDI